MLSLTVDDINILRPFYLFLEKYERATHGYQVKCCPIKLRPSEQSVEAKIDVLTYPIRKQCCQNAYCYLITSKDSTYSHFVELRDSCIAQNTTLNLFNFKQTGAIECAHWPNLYPYTAWCESAISHGGSRLSRKVSFNAKLPSEVVDYALHFELFLPKLFRAISAEATLQDGQITFLITTAFLHSLMSTRTFTDWNSRNEERPTFTWFGSRT